MNLNNSYHPQVAVTATAKEFSGIHRGKQYHEPDFFAVLDRASNFSVKKILLTGMSLSDISFNTSIAQSRPSQCSVTIGIHPYHASEPYINGSDGTEYFTSMAQQINESLPSGVVAAYGELGLDYDHLALSSKETQLRCLTDQLDLCVSYTVELLLTISSPSWRDTWINCQRVV
jgi:TatD DNase family protein